MRVVSLLEIVEVRFDDLAIVGKTSVAIVAHDGSTYMIVRGGRRMQSRAKREAELHAFGITQPGGGVQNPIESRCGSARILTSRLRIFLQKSLDLAVVFHFDSRVKLRLAAERNDAFVEFDDAR